MEEPRVDEIPLDDELMTELMNDINDIDILVGASYEASEMLNSTNHVYLEDDRAKIKEKKRQALQSLRDVTVAGDAGMVDWRGLRQIRYHGSLRPDYDNFDEDLQYSLKLQMIAKLCNWRDLHPDLSIFSDEQLLAMPIHPLHTYTESKQLIITAREDATLYTQGIYIASTIIEKVAVQFGYTMPEGFTESNVLFASLFKRWAGNVAMQRASELGPDGGGGLLGSFSPTMQYGIIFVGSLGAYCSLHLFFGENAKTIYKLLTEVSHNSLTQAGGESVSASGVNPAPFAENQSSSEGGVLGTLNQLSGYINLASKFMNPSSPAPQRPPEERGRPGRTRRTARR